jgi:cytochrome c-type biogenesis protein CcmH/NrfG
VMLGWAMHKASPTDHVATQEALRHLERALQLEPSQDTAHLFLGRILLASDEGERAREHLEAALRLNPDNREAAEQLQALRQP